MILINKFSPAAVLALLLFLNIQTLYGQKNDLNSTNNNITDHNLHND